MLATLSVPDLLPAVPGAKRTVMEHVAPAASVSHRWGSAVMLKLEPVDAQDDARERGRAVVLQREDHVLVVSDDRVGEVTAVPGDLGHAVLTSTPSPDEVGRLVAIAGVGVDGDVPFLCLRSRWART